MTDAKIELLAKTRDGHRMIADAIDEYLETCAPRGAQDLIPDLSVLVWQRKIGPKGAFEISEDEANPRYRDLQSALSQHGGKMTVQGFFVWTLPDGKIARKA